LSTTDAQYPENVDVFVIIHGHFYQPERENPWLGVVEREPSAAPFHDWNERIAGECYIANTVSRILDAKGRIDDIVNNFTYMSFNIGSTLFAWIEKHLPKTYDRIINADWASRGMNEGHGNAIAQPFDHIILPLASRRDRLTALRWGLADFRRRFLRPAEGVWLPEAAVNEEVLEDLIDLDIGFTILAPHQARRIRRIGSRQWRDVQPHELDTSAAYRYFSKNRRGGRGYVDLFFFHGQLSTSASFEHILTNADHFSARIEKAALAMRRPDTGAVLVNIATDGETFGHHEPFADMCLAYLFKEVAPMKNFRITNYAAFLAANPPQYEVELALGEDGLGTSWSCAHGVSRWRRDCGCVTGGRPWWHQRWRAPMRKGLEDLQHRIDETYQKAAEPFLRDPWRARDEFVEIIFDRSAEAVDAFLERHRKKDLAPADRSTVLRLLEAQRWALAMFTSCGWFYSDISGIEALQNLKFAARAAQCAQPFADGSLEKGLLAELERAPSNLPEFGTGRNVYERWAKRSAFGLDTAVACYAITLLTTGQPGLFRPFNYTISEIKREELAAEGKALVGLVEICDSRTCEQSLLAYYATESGMTDVRAYVRPVAGEAEYGKLREQVACVEKAQLPDIFESGYYSWNDFVPEVATGVMEFLVEESLNEIRRRFDEIYAEREELFEAYVAAGVELPTEVRGLIAATLGNLLHREILKRRGEWSLSNFARALELCEQAKRFGVELETTRISAVLTEDAIAEAQRLKGDLTVERFEKLVDLMAVVRKLGVRIRNDIVENIVIEILEESVIPMILLLKDPERDRGDYDFVIRILACAEQLNFSPRKYHELLAEFEPKLLSR